MSGDLVTFRPPGAMANLFAAAHVEETRLRLQNEVEGVPGRETIRRLPTPQERGRLSERMLDIRSLLQPASMSSEAQKRIGEAVGEMLGGWLNISAGLDKREVVAGFTKKLQDLPAWAVLLACQEFQEGRATETINGKEHKLSPDFAPSEARVWTVAREKLNDLYAEERQIRIIMTAKLSVEPVESPEVRERVGGMLQDLAQKMSARTRAEGERDAQKAREEAEAAAARRKKIADDANERRLKRYGELRLHPVCLSNGVLWDPDALPRQYQFSLDEPLPEQAEMVSRGFEV